MKIMFITNCFPPNEIGGAEITMNTVRKQFINEGHTTKVLTIATDKTKPSEDLDVIQVPLANIYDPWRDADKGIFKKFLWKLIDFFNPAMGLRVWSHLKRFNPDVVYTHNLKGFSVSVWLAVKCINAHSRHVFHDYYLICGRCSIEKGGRRCEKICKVCKVYSLPKQALANFCVDRFIGVSGFIADKHQQVLGIPADKIRVVHNARPPDSDGQFFESADNTRDFFKLPRIKNDLFTFGFIGRAEPVKGIEFLFDALSRVDFSYILLIAGRECFPGYIDQLSAKYPNVNFRYLGFSRPKDFYFSVDCVIVPSLWDEPLGGVTYEPMEFGIPVIATRIGGIPEVVLDGVNGLLVEPNNVADFISKINIIALDGDVYDSLSLGTKKSARLFDPIRLKNGYGEDII